MGKVAGKVLELCSTIQFDGSHFHLRNVRTYVDMHKLYKSTEQKILERYSTSTIRNERDFFQ